MKKQLIAPAVFFMLIIQAVFGAPEDRFKGGINAGYDKNSVLDAPMPAAGPRIKISGVPYEQIQSVKGTDPNSIINGIRY